MTSVAPSDFADTAAHASNTETAAPPPFVNRPRLPMSRQRPSTADHWSLPESFTFDGRSVRYGVVGQGPALVCVHGTPWSSFNLRHIIRRLSAQYTVYFFDLVGYGESSKEPGDVSLGVQTDLLSALLDHWQLHEPLVLGHDFGGAITLRTHLLKGRSFGRMVLADPVAVGPWGSEFFNHVREHEQAFAGVPDYIHEAIVRAYIQSAAHRPIDGEPLARTVAPWTGAQGKAAFYRQIAQASQKFTDEVEPLYPTITAPVLILWGKEDTWIPVAKGHQLAQAIPSASLEVIEGAGHLVIEEKPQMVSEAALAFFGR